MNQERILELIAETSALTLNPLKKEELKQDNNTINVTLDMTMGGCVNKQMIDESVISTKNDPDVIKIARCNFDINKTYIEVVAKFVSNKWSADKDEVVIRND